MHARNTLTSLLLLSLTPLLGAAPAPPAELIASAADKGYLGVSISEDEGAVRVVEVLPETAAAAAGIQAGDLLLSVAGSSFENLAGLQEALATHEAGDTVAVLLRRGEEELELGVVLGKRPEPVFERREAPRVRLERLGGDEPRIHVEHGDEDEGRVRIIGPDDGSIRIERVEGEEPRVYVWRSDGDGLHEMEPGEHGIPEDLELFFEDQEAFENQWQSRLDDHMEELHEHLQQGMGHLSEKLHGLHEHDADGQHKNALRHWSRAKRELERRHEGQERELKDLHSHMRTFTIPRVEVPRVEIHRGDGNRWFEAPERGRAFDVTMPRTWHSGGNDEVSELRETVSELRDELRGLREELRALREELRR